MTAATTKCLHELLTCILKYSLYTKTNRLGHFFRSLIQICRSMSVLLPDFILITCATQSFYMRAKIKFLQSNLFYWSTNLQEMKKKHDAFFDLFFPFLYPMVSFREHIWPISKATAHWKNRKKVKRTTKNVYKLFLIAFESDLGVCVWVCNCYQIHKFHSFQFKACSKSKLPKEFRGNEKTNRNKCKASNV